MLQILFVDFIVRFTAGYHLGGWERRFRWEQAFGAVSKLTPDRKPEPAPVPADPPPLDGPAGQLLFNF